MDCIIYIDLFFLINFWMNALILFLVRQITKTYRTIYCLVAAVFGAAGGCAVLTMYLKGCGTETILFFGFVCIILMNWMAFGGKSLLWHIFLFLMTGALVSGMFQWICSIPGWQIGMDGIMVIMVSVVCGFFCLVLEKKSRIRWKEEHMKAKTVLEFGNRKICATALMDTGNKLYDPFFHKPVILVNEKMMKELMECCREEHPEKLHFIPFHSVGNEGGMLEGMTFDCVKIQWQDKVLKFPEVIAASTKAALYKGKDYQVIFHCGLLEEG